MQTRDFLKLWLITAAFNILNFLFIQFFFVRLRAHVKIDFTYSHFTFEYWVLPFQRYFYKAKYGRHFIRPSQFVINSMPGTFKYRWLRRMAFFNRCSTKNKWKLVFAYFFETPFMILHEMSHYFFIVVLTWQRPQVIVKHWMYVYYNSNLKVHNSTKYSIVINHASNDAKLRHNFADAIIALSPFVFHVAMAALITYLDYPSHFYFYAYLLASIAAATAIMPSSADYKNFANAYKYAIINFKNKFGFRLRKADYNGNEYKYRNVMYLAERLNESKFEEENEFDMATFVKTGGCGTVCCAIGLWACIQRYDTTDYSKSMLKSKADLLPNEKIEPFSKSFEWCFDSAWKLVDNTPTGAAKRLLFMLVFGYPNKLTSDNLSTFFNRYNHLSYEYLLEQAAAKCPDFIHT